MNEQDVVRRIEKEILAGRIIHHIGDELIRTHEYDARLLNAVIMGIKTAEKRRYGLVKPLHKQGLGTCSIAVRLGMQARRVREILSHAGLLREPIPDADDIHEEDPAGPDPAHVGRENHWRAYRE